MFTHHTRRRLAIAGGLSLLASFAALALTGTGEESARERAQARPVVPAAAVPLARGDFAEGPDQAMALATAASSLAAEPPIPRLGASCTVELFRDAPFPTASGAFPYRYGPPVDCPGPWAKVIFQLDLSGPRPESASTASLSVELGSLEGSGALLFKGAPQIHEQQPVWRLERDVTDYASAMTQEQDVYTYSNWDNTAYGDDETTIRGTGRLVFYPATPQAPAPRIPDQVFLFDDLQTLPRNIERAYVDVFAQAQGGDPRFWFSCVPTSAASAYPALTSMFAPGDYSRAIFGSPSHGCAGGAYREVEVFVDDQRAGVVPVFPWLPSDVHDLFTNTVDYPVPSVQAINFVPYRVDITPFAGLLSDGAEHRVRAVMVNGEDPFSVPLDIHMTLLLYLDKGSAQVTGEVVRNTLADQPALPTVQNTLAAANDTLQGSIATDLTRQFVIEGYVDTSRGRIRTQVRQTSRFHNVQQFLLDGLVYPDLRGYRQNLKLQSTVERQSRRFLGGQLIAEDRSRSAYPLEFNYDAGGSIGEYDEGDFVLLERIAFSTKQQRLLHGNQYRPGTPRYYTHLADQFAGSHRLDGDPQQDSNWRSRRDYLFEDSRGSCYRRQLTTADGLLASNTAGVGCPGNANRIIGRARPDGSPSSMGWAETD